MTNVSNQKYEMSIILGTLADSSVTLPPPTSIYTYIYTILEFNLFDIIVMLIETSRAILISEIIKWIDEGRNSNRFLGAECRAAESATSVWVL